MPFRTSIRAARDLLILVAFPSPAAAYIHFSRMTPPKTCRESHHVRFLKVAKFDRDKGVIVVEPGEALKGENSRVTSFRQAVGRDTPGGKAILDWVGPGKLLTSSVWGPAAASSP
jgi:hypothetical protein